MNIIDLIIIGLMLLGAVGGYQRGFLGSIVGLFSSILGLLAAYHYYPVLAMWSNDQFQLEQRMAEFFQEHLPLPQAVSQFRIDKIPFPDLSQYLDKLDLPGALQGQLVPYLQRLSFDMTVQYQQKLGQILYQFLASIILNGIAFLIIWFIVDRSINLLLYLYTRMIKGNLLGAYDSIGGFIVGILLTFLTLTIFLGLVTPLLNFAGLAQPTLFTAVLKTMGESVLIPYFVVSFNFLSTKIFGFLFF